MEENYRWYLYKELIGLNYEIINDDLENGENKEIKTRSNDQDINLEIRLAKSLLFNKLVTYEETLILTLRHANNDVLKIILQLIGNIKYYIYMTLPHLCSLNILIEAINLFKNKIFDLVVKGDWDEILALLGNSITMKVNDEDELKARIRQYREILREEHVRYLSDKIEKDPELRKRLTNELGHKIRISYLLDDDKEYRKLCDKYGLIDYKSMF
ncbi:unnamed protein product [Meloidogyne enterolobii]|uniref:Uncharacterized protein n=1 Tax=Meloidogyne enterolobii TaxID=390850 RepID=A0ACB0YI59_MELEN